MGEGTVGEVQQVLSGVPLFAALDEEALGRLAARSVARDYGTGHLLFAAGDDCRGVYVVVSGRVRVFRTSPDGREQVLHTEGPGDAVAELPLFDGGQYPASAITEVESRLVFVPRAEFEALYRDSPDVAQAVIRELGRRLRHLVQVTETLAFRDVAARLAMYLAQWAEQRGTATAGGVELTLDRTREEMSLELGTARESVSRAFKQLAGNGLIVRLSRTRIRIPSVERLRTLARPGERPRYS
ncbi:MAG TPA: Crp/Fnr family transcriptional regulator [Gemmatimonadaceae bacterium]|nr:Crp/Fnr family transcriptional regulator [Gemmatimonadaceae bacterium]